MVFCKWEVWFFLQTPLSHTLFHHEHRMTDSCSVITSFWYYLISCLSHCPEIRISWKSSSIFKSHNNLVNFRIRLNVENDNGWNWHESGRSTFSAPEYQQGRLSYPHTHTSDSIIYYFLGIISSACGFKHGYENSVLFTPLTVYLTF